MLLPSSSHLKMLLLSVTFILELVVPVWLQQYLVEAASLGIAAGLVEAASLGIAAGLVGAASVRVTCLTATRGTMVEWEA